MSRIFLSGLVDPAGRALFDVCRTAMIHRRYSGIDRFDLELGAQEAV